MSFSKLAADEAGSPKWQIALALGGTVIIGAGIYYFLLRSNNGSKSNSNESKEITPVDDTPLGQAQAAKNLGNKYFKEGLYTRAISCYDEALEMCPKENTTELATFYQNRAAANEQLKSWENVLRDCNAALDLNMTYVKALQRRAKACEKLDDLDQALEDLTACCIINKFQSSPDLVNVDRVLRLLGQDRVKENIGTRVPFTPSKYFVKSYFDSFMEDPIINSLYKEKEGDVDESEHPPDKKEINGYSHAKHCLKEGKYDEIIECCSNELALSSSTHKHEALLLRATMHFIRLETAKTLEDLDSLLAMEDVDLKIRVNALIKRGTLHMQKEKVTECLRDFDAAAVEDPKNPDVYHHMGQMNLLVGNINNAILNFQKSVDLNPNFALAVVQKTYTDFRYAKQHEEKDRIAEVIDQFEDAIKNFPKCIESYILYAQALADEEKFDKADEMYKKVIEIDPDNPVNLVHRSLLILQWKGDLTTSRALINKALEIDDKCELAYENLGAIEIQAGNLKRGIELFNKAIDLAKTEMEMAHLYALRDAAVAQVKCVKKLNITIPDFNSL